ncbi:unnamed protein product [Acanthocheilonema viteae]|uniref:RNA-directed DNA polymerase n=1 Tax=Acanthocheilonema viteae TaxID=6277 RepID=A0A498SUT0_ACAVI|nr:unnamed protein product [Acanthocheilonema viteae]
MKAKIEAELNRLLKNGILEPVDPTITPIRWSTPTVNVPKTDGSLRICADFRVTINKALLDESHLIPTFNELITKIGGGETFSILDLKDAYLQIPINKESQDALTIVTHMGYFKYARLPFGLTNAPLIFQRIIDKLLRGCPQTAAYLDDIIITGSDIEEHKKNLRKVLTILDEAGLKVKANKVQLFKNEITYLGYVITKNGIKPSPKKVEAIKAFPTPKDRTALKSFLGILNFNEKFIPHLHPLVSHLHQLTGTKAPWVWGATEDDIFNKAKMLLSAETSLAPYDLTTPLILDTDASAKGFGAVLIHKFSDGERPITYASRTLNKAETNYSTIDKEARAILFGIEKFHSYLYGRKFILRTDHRPLIHLFNSERDLTKVHNTRLLRWAYKLNSYNFDIEYKPGKNNNVADALSRGPIIKDTELGDDDRACFRIRNIRLQKLNLSRDTIRTETRKDNVLKTLISAMDNNDWERPEIKSYLPIKNELENNFGILYFNNRLILPSSLQAAALTFLHRGHTSIVGMKCLARHLVYWKSIDQDIEQIANTCRVCQFNKPRLPDNPTYHWNQLNNPWERIHIDYAEEEAVWIKNPIAKGWKEGKIKTRNGLYSYSVESEGKTWRKHADQLRSAGERAMPTVDNDELVTETVEATVNSQRELQRSDRNRRAPKRLIEEM